MAYLMMRGTVCFMGKLYVRLIFGFRIAVPPSGCLAGATGYHAWILSLARAGVCPGSHGGKFDVIRCAAAA